MRINERKIAYPAILDDTQNDKGVYTVTFPDVPEAISQGNGIADALLMGADALWLALCDQKELPEPSDINAVRADNPQA